MRFIKLCYLFLFFSSSAIAQETILSGAIVIGRTEFMSYKLVYQVDKNHHLKGYSVCDINGKEETKSSITGNYDPKTRMLNFEEKSILSTRSKTPLSEFCLMTVKGKIEKKGAKNIFTGDFTSKSSDPDVLCSSGTILLMSEKEIDRISAKVSKAIDNTPKQDAVNKEQAGKPEALPPVRKIIELSPETTTEFVLKSDVLQLDLVDDKYQDGDKVTVFENGRIILQGFEVSNHVKSIRLETGKSVESYTITIQADDEGSVPPTTVKAVLRNGNENNQIQAGLKKGQKISLVFKQK